MSEWEGKKERVGGRARERGRESLRGRSGEIVRERETDGQIL